MQSMADSVGTDFEEKVEETMMKPWEQHSAVISIPRFDYNAPTSLLNHSFSGFLVTCPIKREKSATKEAISILEKFIGSSQSCYSEGLSSSDENIATKRRKLLVGENGEITSCLENESAAIPGADVGDEVSEGSCMSSMKDTSVCVSNVLSLVKLIRSGLLLFTFPKDHPHDVANTVANIMQSLDSGILKAPLWCHRIFPIQATCTLNEKELSIVVSKLVLQFVNEEKNKLERPIKFAVAYNRRGFEETKMKGDKITSNDSAAVAVLDRDKCFEIVAAAVKEATSDSVVDLSCPELTVLVEMLPISRLPSGSLVAGISVLPHNLVSTKPKLCIKALVSDAKTSNGKKNSKKSMVQK